MGQRGPRPLPTATKKRRGNPGRRPLNDQEPASPPVAKPPRWLRKHARKHWAKLAPVLEGMGVLTQADQVALALLATAIADYIDACDQVAAEGSVVTSHQGSPYQHPAVGIAHRAHDRILRLLREFGLTPSSRTGLQVPAQDAGDLMGDLLGKYGAGRHEPR